MVVERVDDKFRDSGLRPFSWRSLAALSRITASVSKVTGGVSPDRLIWVHGFYSPILASQELMLCYVIFPANLSKAELDSPDCLNRLKVQVTLCVCVFAARGEKPSLN